MINLNPLFEALISLLSALITIYLIPYLYAKTDAKKREKIRYWVDVAVYAAEKAYGSGNGAEKLKYAESILHQNGIELDIINLRALIDASIKEMEQYELPEETLEVE